MMIPLTGPVDLCSWQRMPCDLDEGEALRTPCVAVYRA